VLFPRLRVFNLALEAECVVSRLQLDPFRQQRIPRLHLCELERKLYRHMHALALIMCVFYVPGFGSCMCVTKDFSFKAALLLKEFIPCCEGAGGFFPTATWEMRRSG
jgi:hypothetical protein